MVCLGLLIHVKEGKITKKKRKRERILSPIVSVITTLKREGLSLILAM
jgi:hypothetical protein